MWWQPETEVMHQIARDCQRLPESPEARRQAWNRFSTRTSRRNQTFQWLAFGRLAPKLWDNTFLLNLAIQCVVFYYSSPRKWIYSPKQRSVGYIVNYKIFGFSNLRFSSPVKQPNACAGITWLSPWGFTLGGLRNWCKCWYSGCCYCCNTLSFISDPVASCLLPPSMELAGSLVKL